MSDSPVPNPLGQPSSIPDEHRKAPGAQYFNDATDRGQTQPADASQTPMGGYPGYEGYGRYPIPAPGAANDASTIISDPGRHPDNRSLAPGNTPSPPAHPPGANVSAPQFGAGADYAAPYAPYVPYAPYPPPNSSPARRSVFTRRRRMWVAVGVVALVAILLVGVSYVVFQYLPAQPGVSFCRDLAAQRYDDAYALTSQGFRAQRSQAQFTRDLTTLDVALGNVVACQGAGPLPLAYTFPSGPASYYVALVRQRQGAMRTLTGAIHLSAAGGWQVDAVDTSLWGVNLGALEVAQGYCDALGTQHYAAAYALLDAPTQATLTLGDYTTVEQAHSLISGPVKTCGVTGVGQGNSDRRADLTVSVSRANLGAQSADVALTLAGGVWRLAGVPTGAEGPDVGPYEVGRRYCADLASGQYGAAYDLFTPQYQALNPRAQFVGALQATQSQGITISCGQPDFTTYAVKGGAAGYVVPYIETYLGFPITTTDTLTFARQNGRWLIANSDLQSPLG
ncbi:MAG TPA: hypothetical protein VMV29_14525 [Ktedonobacterales bacterium]|nr:hypothetical protein [Ktedonobacterales bacterium]